ncbi:MAG: choline/carnitine O-acyltransferase [Actinomycetota bacterium]|nr:choline/carnitine O-acyltransferase [Actinomycetota bacterium]
MRTFANEDRLPRVPLPTLEESCERFLAWCAPLLNPNDQAATERAVRSFLQPDSPARRLQAALERYDTTEGVHSWLDTFWSYRYLGRRDRIALNANFFFLFKDSEQGQVERAAGLIAGAVDYKLQLDEERVPPVVQRGQVQSMEQNKYLFSSTRIPGPVQDTNRVPYSEAWPGPSQERHILVFFRGNLFRMEVIGSHGRPHSLEDLVGGLRAVMEAGAKPAESTTSVGQLTTKARSEWAVSRQGLLDAALANSARLDTVERALFCICLEDCAPHDVLQASDHLLHGDAANRWYDKALSLIIFRDGSAGLNGEHCCLDGTTILTFIDALLNHSDEEHARRSGAQSQGVPTIETIQFELNAELRADVRSAGDAFASFAASSATSVVAFEDFGANQIKQLGMSPDAFAQMAYQLAHHRCRGVVGATYESIATRHFRNGRTEAMRVVTPEVIDFVTAMDDPKAGAAKCRTAFRAAAAKHVERAKECKAGQAPEQHLWELQLLQGRCGETLEATGTLDLYQSPGWIIMRDDYLSTSSVPSANVQSFGFGSTGERCIGVGYVLLPNRWNLYLSARRSYRDQMLVFADDVRVAVRELRDLLSSAGGAT